MTTNFFQMLWPANGRPHGYVSTWLKGDPMARCWHSSEFEQAHDYMIAMSQHKDAYFAVAMLKNPPKSGRGTSKDAGALSCLHADFDFNTGNDTHAKSALPKTIGELDDFFVEIGMMPPTFRVNSGNGIHGYWQLAKPLIFTDDVTRTKGATLLKNFQRTIIKLAKERRGWEFDNTSDLARVLRYPGTKNHKTNPPKNVEIL